MKILLIIDALTSGGAQRQLCMLALGLYQKGYTVEILTYHDKPFYVYALADKINVSCVKKSGRLLRAFRIREEIKERKPDVVISFLVASSIYAEFAYISGVVRKLIVSERNLDRNVTLFFLVKTLAHSISDYVVCNSYAQMKMVHRHAPWLRAKLHTVVNAIDTEKFSPSSRPDTSVDKGCIKLLTVGRVVPQKNGKCIINAIALLRKRGFNILLDWYGNRFVDEDNQSGRFGEFGNLKDLATMLDVCELISFYDPIEKIEDVYVNYDVFVLASVHEGCPNVLLEAMASGLPVIASKVADNEVIVEEGKSGFLFESNEPVALADCIEKLISLGDEKRIEMGKSGRASVSRMFDVESMVENYERLFFL